MKRMSRSAKLYIGGVLGLGAAALLLSLAFLPEGEDQWLNFAILSGAAALAQLFRVVTPRNQAYYLTVVFIFAAVLVLPPGALALLVLVAFIPDWIKVKYPWHIQLFNIANFTLAAFAARALYEMIDGAAGNALGNPIGIIAALLAAGLFTLVNHFLLAVVLRLARGHSLRGSQLFELENFLTDATLSCMGIIVALLWQIGPWLILVTAAPLLLIYRALNTPNLRQAAATDAKTGLYNSGHFSQVLAEEHRRAERFGRPLAVIMADLDLLRNVNNSYGHLAGDVVLKGTADIIKESLREYDVASRFGGEEFAILLPETGIADAMQVAERMRQRLESAGFKVDTSVEPIRATISLGVAAFPDHGSTPKQLIHQADLAVYYAKLSGRNRTCASSPETRALSLGMGRDELDGPPEARNAYGIESAGPLPPEVSEDRTESSGAGGEMEGRTGEVRPVNRAEEVGAIGSPRTPGVRKPTPEGDRRARSSWRIWRRRRASDLSWTVALVIAAAAVATAALWVTSWSWPWLSGANWIGLGALGVLTIASQAIAIETYGKGRISIGAIFVLVGGILFGIPGALALASVLGVANWILRRGVLYRAVFDTSNVSLSGAVGASLYQSLSAWFPASQPIAGLIASAIAGAAYYAVNVGLLSLVLALVEKSHPAIVWKEKYRWLFPYYIVYGGLAFVIGLGYLSIGLLGLMAFFVPPFMLHYAAKQYIERTEQNVKDLKRANLDLQRSQSDLVQSNERIVGTLEELHEAYSATLKGLSAALDSRDSETEGHSQRVLKYTEAIARKLQVAEQDMQPLLKGAMLHDIGKIGVPDSILLKPGQLTPREWAVMRTHPEKGYSMLAGIDFLSDTLPVVLHHHERFDGQGYPHGLSGQAIPLSARIFAVADTLDAMTSDRPYRKACSFETARLEISRCAGAQFDPQIVEAFLQIDIKEIETVLGREAPELRDQPKSRLQLVG